jgi:hypothetical protein
MKFFGFNISRDKKQEALAPIRKELEDIKLSIGTLGETKKVEEAIAERRRTLPKPLHYKTNSPTADTTPDRKSVKYIYYGPGYDLSEIGRAMDVEPYVNQSVRKHREQIMKSGFSINCEDDELKAYLNRRLFEMSLVSGMTTQQWLREFVTNLVAFGTSFLVIKRDATRANGKPIRINSKTLEPIAALFPLDSTSVSVSLNDLGYPVKWKQRIDNPTNSLTELIFDADDIIVATIDRKTGFIFGTPYILPTLDDVRTLRRLEELAELTAQRNTFPQIHYKVGSDLFPAQVFDDGSDEISFVKQMVESLSKEGGMVTSHRVEAEIIGGDRQVMDLLPYLEYFEARVLGGLRLSEVDLGRSGSANKASAVTVSQGLQDSARDFQAVISDVLTNFLLIPLALEGGFDLQPDENLPSFEFHEMDQEKDRADEAHGADLYMAGAITHEELRRDHLGKKPLSDEEKATLKPEDDHKKALELGEQAGEQAIAKAKVSKATSVKNKVANKTRPKNQHGRKATKTKVTKNSLDLLSQAYNNNAQTFLLDARHNMWDLIDKHKLGVNSEDPHELSTKQEQIEAIFTIFIDQALIEAHKALDPVMSMGSKDCLGEIGVSGNFEITKKYIDRFYKNSVEKSFIKLKEAGIKLINENDALSGGEIDRPLQFYVTSIFDSLKEELKSLTDKQIDLAYRVGYARAARSHGYKTIILKPDEENWFCEDCGELGDIEVSLVDKNNSYANSLNTHQNCAFEITLGAK